MAEELKIRGMLAKGVADFVDKNYEAAVRDKILQAVSADIRTARPGLQKNDWYPIRYILDYFRAIDSVLGDPGKTADHLERCGISIASDATNSFMKLLIKVLTIRMFARQFPEFWRKYHSAGTIEYDLSALDDKRVIFHLEPYEYQHLLAMGFLRFVFDALGKKNVRVAHNCPAGERTVSKLRLEVTWD